MIIGIDGNEANILQKVGVNQYAFEVLWGLYRLEDASKEKNNYVIYLKTAPGDDLPKENSYWKYKVITGKGLWIITKLMPELWKGKKPDVFFSPSHYLPLLTRIPRVCTIHDLGYLKFSGQFRKYDFWQLKYWTAISIYISKYIIAVSESTKKDIVRHYPFASKKINIIHHGFDKRRFNSNVDEKVVRRVKEKYKISGDYLLFLSMLKPSKNVEGLLEAFSKVKKKINIKLVIAGKKGWLYKSIFKKVEKLHLKNDVIFTDYIQENEKAALIKGAKIFVLPSFWEGFGMDVLHSMACGTPVIVSRVASLPEVAGEAGIYINPKREKSLSDAILNVLFMNDKEYNKLVKRGFKQVRKFSWEKTAKKTLNVLERAGVKK